MTAEQARGRRRYTPWRVSLMLAAMVAAICLSGLVASARAGTVMVTSASDSGPGSLRAVIAAAGAGDTVTFDTSLKGQTIALTSGAIAIDKGLTIEGPGAAEVVIDANHGSRIFTVSSGDLSISGLTLADGAAPREGGAIYTESAGSLTVSGCTFAGNTAGGAGGSVDDSNQGHGGAIYVSPASGPTSISESSFSANVAGGLGGTGWGSGLGSGGAIWDAGESLTVVESSFVENTTGGNGGGGVQSGSGAGGAIQKSGGLALKVSGSEFTSNTAGGAGGSGRWSGLGIGGAIYVSRPSGQSPSLEIVESSFSANAAGGAGGEGPESGIGFGGAAEHGSEGPVTVSRTSFKENSAGGAGGAGGVGGVGGPAAGSGGGLGGALFVSEFASSTSVSDSIFVANKAGGDGGSGSLSGRGEGGAIKGESGTGPVTVANSTFTDNVAGGRSGVGTGSGAGAGGAINSFSSLTVADSTFTGNAAGGQGGSGEGAFGFGGAIRNFNNVSPLTVSGSTFAENTAGGQGGGGVGGAIDADSVSGRSAYLTNSTLVGNGAGGSGVSGRGGAVAVSGMSMSLAGVTISSNTVGSGGAGAGIDTAADVIGQEGSVTAKATIVSGNSGAANCDAPAVVSSYSLEGPSPSDTSCGFDLPSADPLLEPLADSGGPTETQALPPSSPAVDAVPVAKCPTKVDQRGEPRPDNGKSVCDVGAFELQDPPVAPAITSAAAATLQVGRSGTFTVTATGLPMPTLSLIGALPSGVTFVDNGDGTARLSGTPAAGTGGSYPITIKASNGALPDAEQGFTLTVQAPPTASVAIPVDGATYTRGQAVATSFTCANGAGGLGIASCVDQDGRPSGAPLDTATVGRHAFTVTATSKDGLTGSANVVYTIEPPSKTLPLPAPSRRLISYRQEGGIGGLRPSLVVFKNRQARVRLGSCAARFDVRQKAWSGLRAALRGARLRANAGSYPAPKGSADLITHVVKAPGGKVRIALPQREPREVIRELRPLLKILNRLVSAGKRRMPASCKGG